MKSSRSRSSVIYVLLIAAIVILVVYNFQQQSTTQQALTINEVAAMVMRGEAKRIVEDDNQLLIIDADGKEYTSNKEPDATLVGQLKELGVSVTNLDPNQVIIEIKPPSPWLGLATVFSYLLPFLILGGVFWFVFRQAQGSNNAAMAFGKSRARMFTGDQPTVTFDDVAGIEEAKEELQEVVEFLKEPEKFMLEGRGLSLQ